MSRDAQASVAVSVAAAELAPSVAEISINGNYDDSVTSQTADDRAYGSYAAELLRKCSRDVALASSIETRLAAFLKGAATLGEAVSGLWLPKNAVVDRLVDIAAAHNGFGLDEGQIERIIADAIDVACPVQTREKLSSKPKRRLISHRASDLQPEKLTWIWPGRIPEGKLVLLGGPPGLGKSQVTAFIAATVSNGGVWPCGEGSTIAGSVIFMSAEDGIQDTIVPRLIAAGAKTDRVHIVAAATKPDGTGRKTFSLKTDVDLLEEKAKEIGDVRLIVVDPISAYMGGSDGNGNVETREVLEPLAGQPPSDSGRCRDTSEQRWWRNQPKRP